MSDYYLRNYCYVPIVIMIIIFMVMMIIMVIIIIIIIIVVVFIIIIIIIIIIITCVDNTICNRSTLHLSDLMNYLRSTTCVRFLFVVSSRQIGADRSNHLHGACCHW